MNALRGHRAQEDDGLQTDVMRFMAIIAFCLVAVLALVNDAAVEADRAAAKPPTPEATTEPEPVSELSVEAAGLAAAAPAPVVKPDLEITVAPPEPVLPTPEPAASAQEPSLPPPPEPTVEIATAPQPEPEPEPEPEAGLTLRFASDADLIRLVRSGRIRLYAFEADRYQVLDRGFTFRAAQPPQQFHELERVPRRVEVALSQDFDTPQWAVRLPEATSNQIARLVQQHRSGQLVIDRTGGVQHVAAR